MEQGQPLLQPLQHPLVLLTADPGPWGPHQDEGSLGWVLLAGLPGGVGRVSHGGLISPLVFSVQDDGVPKPASHAGHAQVPAPLPGT